MDVCLSSQLCWQKAQKDDLLGELLFMSCLTWIKIKLEVYELRCLFWHLYELWAWLSVIYVYRKEEINKKNKWSSLKSYSGALSKTAGKQRGERKMKSEEPEVRGNSTVRIDEIYQNSYFNLKN